MEIYSLIINAYFPLMMYDNKYSVGEWIRWHRDINRMKRMVNWEDVVAMVLLLPDPSSFAPKKNDLH